MLTGSCPIDHHTIDEHVARLNGFFGFSLLLLGYFTSPVVWLIVFVDFFLRALTLNRYSYFARTSEFIVNLLHLQPLCIDRAPKLFASRVGLLMSTLLLAFYFLGIHVLWQLILLLFLTATFLESFLNYCLGCQLYSLFLNFSLRKQK